MTIVTEVVMMTSFSKNTLNTLTTNQLSGQLFAILAMFLAGAVINTSTNTNRLLCLNGEIQVLFQPASE